MVGYVCNWLAPCGWLAGCLTSRLAGSVQYRWLVLRLTCYVAGWAGCTVLWLCG